jgi:hypothetical protein
MSTNAPLNVAVRTIISHSDVRDNLLQHSLSLRELLVLRLCSLKLLAELLDARYGELCASQGEKPAFGARTCIFPRWKNLASWLIVQVNPRSDQAEVACGGLGPANRIAPTSGRAISMLRILFQTPAQLLQHARGLIIGHVLRFQPARRRSAYSISACSTLALFVPVSVVSSNLEKPRGLLKTS